MRSWKGLDWGSLFAAVADPSIFRLIFNIFRIPRTAALQKDNVLDRALKDVELVKMLLAGAGRDELL